MPKFFNANMEVDVELLTKTFEEFLKVKQISIPKGRFPVRLPSYTKTLHNKLVEQCNVYNNTDSTMSFCPSLEICLGEVHYRLDDISEAMTSLKSSGMNTAEMHISGPSCLIPIQVFTAEMNSKFDDLFRHILKKENEAMVMSFAEVRTQQYAPMNLIFDLKFGVASFK